MKFIYPLKKAFLVNKETVINCVIVYFQTSNVLILKLILFIFLYGSGIMQGHNPFKQSHFTVKLILICL